jgi:hypothetical protein
MPAFDAPSAMIRPSEPIPYATLAIHLRFSTKSRMQLLRLQQQVVQVYGPVWQVEQHGKEALLHMGTAQESCVRAHFIDAGDVKSLREGQEVEVTGTFTFRGTHVLLENASLRREEGIASPLALWTSAGCSSTVD